MPWLFPADSSPVPNGFMAHRLGTTDLTDTESSTVRGIQNMAPISHILGSDFSTWGVESSVVGSTLRLDSGGRAVSSHILSRGWRSSTRAVVCFCMCSWFGEDRRTAGGISVNKVTTSVAHQYRCAL